MKLDGIVVFFFGGGAWEYRQARCKVGLLSAVAYHCGMGHELVGWGDMEENAVAYYKGDGSIEAETCAAEY